MLYSLHSTFYENLWNQDYLMWESMIFLLKITRNITALLSLVRSPELRSCASWLSPGPPGPTSSAAVWAASCCSSCCSSSACPCSSVPHCAPTPPAASCTGPSRPWYSRGSRPHTCSGRPHLPAKDGVRLQLYQGWGGDCDYLSQDHRPHQEWCRTKISAIWPLPSPLPLHPTSRKPSKNWLKPKSSCSFVWAN